MTSGSRSSVGSAASAVNRSTETISDEIHQVRIEPTGEKFACPAGKPILDAAHAANILMAYSCRGGLCGTCKGRVLEGRVVYPKGMPAATNDSESAAGMVLFCSAHATTDLVIELLAPQFPYPDMT